MKFINQGGRNTIFDLANNDLRICIHKLHGLGDELFLNCHAMNMKDIDLNTEDFMEAVENAKKIISERVNYFVSESSKFIDDHSEIEFSKWRV